MSFPTRLRRHGKKALLLGIVNAALLSAVMVPVFQAGLSPMPRPPSLAFAEMLFARALPLPVGLLFHLVYVTLWSAVFVAAAYPRLTFLRALLLGLALWIAALVVFFPIVGWGLLGLSIGPRLLLASLVPHLLFAVFLWILCRLAFRTPTI